LPLLTDEGVGEEPAPTMGTRTSFYIK